MDNDSFIELKAKEKWNIEKVLKFLDSDDILKTVEKKEFTGAIKEYQNERQQIEIVVKNLIKKASIKNK